MSSRTIPQHRVDQPHYNRRRPLRTHGFWVVGIQGVLVTLRLSLGCSVVDQVEVQFRHQTIPKLVQSDGAWPLS